MANTNAPFGFRQYSGTGSAPTYEQVAVAIGYNTTNIFYGDPVEPVNDGTVAQGDGTTAAAGIAGVFVGCQYTDPSTKQPRNAQYWPAGTVASDAVAYVVDDPYALFKVVVCSSGTTVASLGRTAVGQNAALAQNAGSTITGDSKVAVLATTGTATTLPLRIIDVVPETANASGSYTEVIVKFGIGVHTYTTAVAVA